MTTALAGVILLTPPASASAAPVQRVGHTEMAWTVTDANGNRPPDSFGGTGGLPWAGADRIWNQPGFTGAYTIVMDGREMAAYCGDFHNPRHPEYTSQWVRDPDVFQGSDKALTKLSFAQWRWGATTDPDVGAALNLYTHFLGSPGDRSNTSGVPVPDINDNDVLDEVVTALPPHQAVGPILSTMDQAAEDWSASFGHRSTNVALGVALFHVDGQPSMQSIATGLTLPVGSYDLGRASESTTATTAGVALALRDVSNASQHTLAAGQPQTVELADVSDVILRSQISETAPPIGVTLTDSIEVAGLVVDATAEVRVELFDLTVDPDASGPPLADETRGGLSNGVTRGFTEFEVTTEVAGHTLGYRHRLLATSDGATAGPWSELGIESETGVAASLQAEVHLRKVVSSQSKPTWVEAQRGAPWSHGSETASVDPRDGSFDDSAPGPSDGTPVFAAGDVVSFRYELWVDDDSTGGVSWGDELTGIIIDDAGTTEANDDFTPEYIGGDDGDNILERGETWVSEAAEQRTAVSGEVHVNTATVRSGAIVDPLSGQHGGVGWTAPRQDPAGYVVPCLSTSATDRSDGDRMLEADGGVISDAVSYCNLVAGVEYTVEATVVDRASATTTEHTGSSTFMPTASDGVVNVEIAVTPGLADSLARAGAYVVFETLYLTGTDAVVATHADIDDAAQTFVIPLPPPATTLPTTTSPTTTSPTTTLPPLTTSPPPSREPPITVEWLRGSLSVSSPTQTTPPKPQLPRTGDGVGRVLANLGAIVLVAGGGLLGVARWRRPEGGNPPNLAP